MVSRIKAGRGHDLALAAFARLRQQTPNVRLLFVGRGEGEAELRSRVNVSGLADRVYFLGYRTDDLPAIYAALDVHLLLGEGSDGTCRAALEAMACGTPVVALPVGTLPETIHDGETGLLVEHDPEALAAAVEEVLSAPHLRERARGYAERELSLERRVDTAEKMFLELTGVRRQTAE
jgi:glycosyltransferase involved in cell wall biosynthesis